VQTVANTPAEITHLLEEIQAKDMHIRAFQEEIHKRDTQLQKWVRVNGGHVQNPKEDAFSKTINDCYDKCEILQAEKLGLSEKALIVLERQIKRLDMGLRGLSAREEFPSDWNGPSLLSGTVTGVNTPATGGGGAVHVSGPLQAVSGNIGSAGGIPNIANAAQMRMAQQAAAKNRSSTSGAQTPTNMPRSQREGSSEANKRRRLNASLGALPTASSNLRQSSLGPGTPKAGTPGPTANGTSRAGSAQPARPTAGQKKASSTAAPNRKPAPSQVTSNRKRDRDRARKKGDRRRQLKSDRATPSTNASMSSDDEASGASPTPSSLPRSQADGAGDRRGGRDRGNHHEASDEDDEEEGEEDNNLYCFCQKPSYGEMIGCDNDNCEFQWFHYGCVGIKEQPSGEWLCPNCRKLPKSKIVKEGQ
jgi:inhibitor of growth protein 3